jgi:glutamyl-tRNA synthetase
VSVRVRFAPSPTGSLHVGNARTALFNWLFARRHAGAFILRIEDTDRERSRPEWEAAIVEDLRWLGLSWDEGPDVGGPAGPYRQSERLDRYRAAGDPLLRAGKAYYCFCSPAALGAQREELRARGLPPRYDGRCRGLSPMEIARRTRANEPAAVRFAMPRERIPVHDVVKGVVQFLGSDLDDFVILRADGSPSYNLAATLDDFQMGITHVLRGEDHLANTPRQMALARALGWEPPTFAHVPLIHGSDGAPLSKRHGAVSVAEHRAAGILPEGLVNYLAVLGWSPPAGAGEVMDLPALSGLFALDRVSRSAARFDPDRLAWFNRQHLRRLPAERLLKEVSERLAGADPRIAARAVEAVRRDAPNLEAFAEGVAAVSRGPCLDGTHPVTASERRVLEGASRALRGTSLGTEAEAQAFLDQLGKALEMKGGDLMRPLRMALVGSARGLPVATLLWVLGSVESLRRLDRALALAATATAKGR